MKITEDLISAKEAAEILSKNAGRTVSQDYVRILASPRYGKLTSVQIDGRTKLYKRHEVEAIVVAPHPGRRKKNEQPK